MVPLSSHRTFLHGSSCLFVASREGVGRFKIVTLVITVCDLHLMSGQRLATFSSWNPYILNWGLNWKVSHVRGLRLVRIPFTCLFSCPKLTKEREIKRNVREKKNRKEEDEDLMLSILSYHHSYVLARLWVEINTKPNFLP